jgi:hypothetical protein
LVVHAIDDRGHDQEADPEHAGEQHQIGQEDGRTAPEVAAHEELDQWPERDRQEDRDEQQPEDAPDQPKEIERREDREPDEQDADDRAVAHRTEPMVGIGGITRR